MLAGPLVFDENRQKEKFRLLFPSIIRYNK